MAGVMPWSEIPDFPKNCPPSDAVRYTGPLFCFVISLPATPRDLRTAYDKKIHISKDACQRRSLSVGKTAEYLNQIAALFPGTIGSKIRAMAIVNETDGLLKRTGNVEGHHSFWLNPAIKGSFHQKFQSVES